MYERFDDPTHAVSFLTKGLLSDFPDAEADVIWMFNKRARQESCSVSQISPVLTRMCRKFPKASVEYRPDNRYGYVAEVQCHGEMNSGRNTAFMRRGSGSPRAKVVVLLRRIHQEDVLLGASMAPPPEPAVEQHHAGA